LRWKHDKLKIVESALKRKQGKLQKHAGRTSSKKNAKASAKKSSDDDTSSDESMNNMESRIPLKKQYQKQYAARTIWMNSNGEVVKIEDSDLEDDRKMPAKLSKKKANKKSNKKTVVSNPMYTSTDESDDDVDLKTSKEEKAFLKSIDKAEKKAFDSDDESD
jgi:hypothetical protein